VIRGFDEVAQRSGDSDAGLLGVTHVLVFERPRLRGDGARFAGQSRDSRARPREDAARRFGLVHRCRTERGIRGSLTFGVARRFRGEFRQLARLERGVELTQAILDRRMSRHQA
jgi:hypothetical protein